MTDIEPLPERVDRIERKLDTLSVSVDRRFDEVDKRFGEVSEHVVEQRQYTEFAFETLRKAMLDGFDRLEGLIATNTRGLAGLGRRLERFEDKFDEFVTSQRPKPARRPRRVQKKR